MAGRSQEAFLAECGSAYAALDPVTTSTWSFIELVQMAWEQGLRLGRVLLRERLEADPRAEGKADLMCRGCENSMRVQERNQHRRLHTIVGRVDYHRAYAVCDRCGLTRVPLDEALGIPETGPSIDALHKICHAAVSTRSFEDGAEVLRVQAGLQISRKHVRCLAEREGQGLVQDRAEHVKRYQGNEKTPPSSETSPEVLVIAADGGRVQTRQRKKEDRWKEDKVGVVYDAHPHPQPDAKPGEYEGAKAQTKTYVATMEPWEAMGWMLRVEAEKRGYAQAKQQLFLGDGAKPIREVKNLHFPEATFIIDWAHATEHVSQSAKAAFGEGTPQAQAWYEKRKGALWDGKIDEIIQDLNRLSQQVGLPRQGDPDSSPRVILYRNATSYFPNNKDAMNYPLFRSHGWPIGSGVAEGAVKQFAIRLKGSEKFWNISNTGAEEMLALCALHYSEDGRWERHWQSRGHPHPRQQSPP